MVGGVIVGLIAIVQMPETAPVRLLRPVTRPKASSATGIDHGLDRRIRRLPVWTSLSLGRFLVQANPMPCRRDRGNSCGEFRCIGTERAARSRRRGRRPQIPIAASMSLHHDGRTAGPAPAMRASIPHPSAPLTSPGNASSNAVAPSPRPADIPAEHTRIKRGRLADIPMAGISHVALDLSVGRSGFRHMRSSDDAVSIRAGQVATAGADWSSMTRSRRTCDQLVAGSRPAGGCERARSSAVEWLGHQWPAHRSRPRPRRWCRRIAVRCFLPNVRGGAKREHQEHRGRNVGPLSLQ